MVLRTRTAPGALRLAGGRVAWYHGGMPTPLDALRTRCLALPEEHEVEAWGEPTFRVGKRMFAVVSSPRSSHNGGRWGV
jgi:hypothetical protein